MGMAKSLLVRVVAYLPSSSDFVSTVSPVWPSPKSSILTKIQSGRTISNQDRTLYISSDGNLPIEISNGAESTR